MRTYECKELPCGYKAWFQAEGIYDPPEDTRYWDRVANRLTGLLMVVYILMASTYVEPTDFIYKVATLLLLFVLFAIVAYILCTWSGLLWRLILKGEW